ncbi:MAG: discoidin domain-containing protein [Tannerella sp.]|jgi:hypothetical protein|nr:discoidin domain-containing protein [Tannerella sp.]
MKQKFRYPIAAAILLWAAASCENFMDIHKEYTKGGEIVYSPKVDSTVFIAGKERILFRFWLYNSPNVESVNVYWNSRNDSLSIPVSPSSGYDSAEVILPNMREQSYTFDIRTTDNFGHKSLWTTNFGNSYGTFYESTLMERRIRELAVDDKNGIVTFFTGIEGMVRTEIRYLKKDGSTHIASTSRLDNVALCPGAQPGSGIECRSLFIPEEQSIDTFATAWLKHTDVFPEMFSYNRDNWKVIAVSDETASDGGGMNTLIDNNLESFWHSKWEGGSEPLPHWAIIDMESPKNIVKIETYRRNNNTNSKDVEYYTGPDPDPNASTWVKIGSGQFPDTNPPDTRQAILTINVDKSVNTSTGRYLKMVLPTSYNDPFTSIAEVYLYGN